MSSARVAVCFAFVLTLCLPAAGQLPRLPLEGPQTQTAKAPIPLPPASPGVTPQLTPQDVGAFMDGFLPLQLQRDDVAGATISITQNGQPLLLKGYGYADWKKKTPVNPVSTTFRPGSISKLFTYVLMMQLVEQGKLDLDANVQRYLDFQIEPGPKPIGDVPITLRNLATHTAGFEEAVHDIGSDKSGKLPMGLREYLVRNQPHRFATPGKALAYSNYGIALIGYIVQRTAGVPYTAYVKQQIFEPLGMTHSTFEQPLPAGMMATKGYLKTSKADTGFEGWTPVPAGALSSTAADMAIFGEMLLEHGSFNGRRILEPKSVDTLLSPQFTPAPGVEPWDLGFYDEDRNGLRFIGHGGDLLACHSQFWVETTHGLVFFISYNSAGAASTAREELFRAFVDRYLPGAPVPHPAYVKMTAKELAPYTGYFLTSRRADSTKLRLADALGPREVEATKEGELTISTIKDFRGQMQHLHPIGNDSFYEEQGQFTVHFERDAAGRVTGYAGPGHSDRASFAVRPPVLNTLLGLSLGTLLAVFIAPLVRAWRRAFHRRRTPVAPQPGTMWMTLPLQLAACGLVVVLVWMGVLLTRIGDLTSFYQIGHLDPSFVAQNILVAVAMVAMLGGMVSGLRVLRRKLRLITKVKFALAVFACGYFLWFFVFFHFVGNAHRY